MSVKACTDSTRFYTEADFFRESETLEEKHISFDMYGIAILNNKNEITRQFQP